MKAPKLDRNGSIVILTGSGISAESGVPTFRDDEGLWKQYNIEEVATPQAFATNPALVYEFYNKRRAQAAKEDIQPNAAHKALVKLEQNWPGSFLLVTQNVDDLHERAGSQNCLHMHGELFKTRCHHCGHVWNDHSSLTGNVRCPSCSTPKSARPDIVWFGEMPFYMDEIGTALASCDLFISIGTSGNVYPAAGFVYEAAMAGAQTAEINLEPSANAHEFDHGLYGKAGEKVPEYVETLLSWL